MFAAASRARPIRESRPPSSRARQACGPVSYITGWRTLSEILPLQWCQVDFQAGTVTLDPGTTKNKDGRVFPFTVELRSVLEEQKARRDAMQREGLISPWVFTYQGRQFKRYRKSWKSACQPRLTGEGTPRFQTNRCSKPYPPRRA